MISTLITAMTANKNSDMFTIRITKLNMFPQRLQIVRIVNLSYSRYLLFLPYLKYYVHF